MYCQLQSCVKRIVYEPLLISETTRISVLLSGCWEFSESLSNTSFPTSRDFVLTNWTIRLSIAGTSQTCCRRYVRVLCYSESLWGKSPDTGQRLPWRCATVAGSNSRATEGGEACALTAEPRGWVTVFVIDKVMQVACAHKHCDACYQDGDYSRGTRIFWYNVLIWPSYKWKRKISSDLVLIGHPRMRRGNVFSCICL